MIYRFELCDVIKSEFMFIPSVCVIISVKWFQCLFRKNKLKVSFICSKDYLQFTRFYLLFDSNIHRRVQYIGKEGDNGLIIALVS